MARLFASVLGFFGSMVAAAGSSTCIMIFLDEPECPKSIIEK